MKSEQLTADLRVRGIGNNAIPAELRACPQWVNWTYRKRDGEDKPTKVPICSATGQGASSTDKATWATFDEAYARFAQDPAIAGIGFVFSADDPYIGIDLDNSVDPVTGKLSDLAANIVGKLNSYTEYSVSGKGLHIYARGAMPGGAGRKNTTTGVEAYSQSRFFIVSGRPVPGTVDTVEDRQDQIDAILPELFRDRTSGASAVTAVAGGGNQVGDDELIRKAKASANGEKFAQLWEGRWQDAGYPSQSEADMALCHSLMFWTNRNPERVDRLFRTSGLMREKWERRDYRARALSIALQNTHEGYGPGKDLSKAFRRPDDPLPPLGETPPFDVIQLVVDVPIPDRPMGPTGLDVFLAENFGSRFEDGDINQTHFAQKFNLDNDILYEPNQGEFYRYDDRSGLWKLQTADHLKTDIRRAIKRAADLDGVRDIGVRLSNGELDSVVKLLRGYAELKSPFERKRKMLHLKNGMLDLEVDPPVLKPFDKAYYSRNQCPISYDPSATCPRFVGDLLRPVMSDDDIGLLQRCAGMALLGENLLQKIVLLTGHGGAGKGTFANVIEKIIGEENVTQLRTAHLGERFELYGFIGKSLLTGKDVPGSFLNDRGAHVLKALVGNDLLDAEKKGGDRVQIRGNFNVLIAANSRLKVRLDSDTGAWKRRLLIIEYRERPASIKTVPNFDDILVREEGPGIVNWMVEGVVKLLTEIKTIGGIQLTPGQGERTANLLAESESVKVFVRCCVAADEASDVTVEELVAAYTEYCDERGWDPLSVHQVQRELIDAMNEVHRASKRNDIKRDGKARKGFSGLKIKAGFTG